MGTGKTAFVFSGGASLGAIQAGMLQALTEAEIHPDIVLGTSVGAMNAGFVAGGGTADELVDIWLGLRSSRVFPVSPVLGLQGFLGKRNHFVSHAGVRRVLRHNLRFERLEDAALPITVLATDVQTGQEVRLESGPAVTAILASTSLPGVFAPVTHNGRVLVDGGVANNTPISAAIEAGATEVWVLNTGYSCALPAPPTTPFALALHSVGLLIQQRLLLETTHADYPVPVHLIPPPCPVMVLPTDFSHAAELIESARAGTSQWLANGKPFALPLIHSHRATRP
jgi:NTE family protein